MSETTTADMAKAAIWIHQESSTAADKCVYCGIHFSGTDRSGVVERWWDSEGRGPMHHRCAKEMMRPVDKRMQLSVSVHGGGE